MRCYAIVCFAAAVVTCSAQPSITGLQNNYSFLLPGTPNYAFAQGGIFILYGANLAPQGVLSGAFNPQLNRNLGGVSIKVTVAGTTTEAIPYYVSPTQLSAILPSATPTGTGTVTVSYNGATSAGFPITVVPSAVGIMTLSGNGLGQAVMMDAGYNLLTLTNPAKEEQTVIFWGTGVGRDPNDETRLISAPQSLNSLPFEFYIGNRPAEVAYRGRSQYPGLDQIVAKIPRGVTGCYVSVYAKTGNVISNFTTIPVAPGSACGELFATPEQVQSFASRETITAGWLYLSKFTSHVPAISVGGTTIPASTVISNAATAQFLSYKPFDYTNYGSLTQPSFGNCVTAVFNFRNPFEAPIVRGLDPGPVSITLPNGTERSLTKNGTTYSLTGGGGPSSPPLFIPDSGGTFTYKGAGAAEVGPFTASITVPPLITWTNRTAITVVNRSQSLEITWTGGDPTSYVVVQGATTDLNSVLTAFACTERTPVGRLTVPRDILASMVPSAVPAGSPIPTGQLLVNNFTHPAKITVPMIDNPNIIFQTGETSLVPYQ